MPDIFISYSRKDSPHAIALAEKLRAAGMEIWMDQTGIEAATNWGKEIVGAIKECWAFCLLLSSRSLASRNVIKEVSLASQFRRSIVPIELEKVEVTDDFHYQLAGLQRVKIENFDGILRALTKLGVGSFAPTPATDSDRSAKQTQYPNSARSSDQRKSLMVLPFEDLSPTKDNEWFADGLMSELIGALSRIKSLRLIDQKTSREFKNISLKTSEIARELDVRYFIEGSVRKFGEQIKISAALLDIERGEYLWQDSHKGVFSEIFEIQEAVAAKVVDGLTLTLSSEERRSLLNAKSTENAEAYELYLKAREYQRGGSKEGLEHAIALESEALKLDVDFAEAYNHKANCLALLYRSYDHSNVLLDDAEALVRTALTLKPSLSEALATRSRIALARGDIAAAVTHANEYIRREPTSADGHSVLGFVYAESFQFDLAIPPFEACLALDPNAARTYFNLCQCCEKAQEWDKLKFWSNAGLPKYERLLRLRPDDERGKVDYAVLLHWSGDVERATTYLRSLHNIRDAMTEFNIGCLWVQMDRPDEAIMAVRKAFDLGFQRYDLFRMFEGPILEMPEYKQLIEDIERREASVVELPQA